MNLLYVFCKPKLKHIFTNQYLFTVIRSEGIFMHNQTAL